MTLRKKCPYSELFWSVFSRIRTEYGEIIRVSPYSVGMRENADQSKSEYGQFSHSVIDILFILLSISTLLLYLTSLLYFSDGEHIKLFKGSRRLWLCTRGSLSVSIFNRKSKYGCSYWWNTCTWEKGILRSHLMHIFWENKF